MGLDKAGPEAGLGEETGQVPPPPPRSLLPHSPGNPATLTRRGQEQEGPGRGHGEWLSHTCLRPAFGGFQLRMNLQPRPKAQRLLGRGGRRAGYDRKLPLPGGCLPGSIWTWRLWGAQLCSIQKSGM